MSRQPPIPPASKPTHGPDAVPKTSVDISHRVRHQVALRAQEAAKAQELSQADFRFWTLALAGAVAAGVVWFATANSRAVH